MLKPLVLASGLILLAPAVFACEPTTAGDLTVQHAWSRATIGAGRPGVLYLEIANGGTEDDVLTGVTTPAAEMPMLHETIVTDGIASMPHVQNVPVPAGATTRLAPGGFHGMLMKLTAALAEGESFPVTLTFARAGEVTVNVEVVSMRAEGSSCEDDH